jgi:hypothetical protein
MKTFGFTGYLSAHKGAAIKLLLPLCLPSIAFLELIYRTISSEVLTLSAFGRRRTQNLLPHKNGYGRNVVFYTPLPYRM